MSLNRIVTIHRSSRQRSVGKFVCQNPLHYEWGSGDGIAKAICRQSVLSVLTDIARQRGSLVKAVHVVCRDCQASADTKVEVINHSLYEKVSSTDCSRYMFGLMLTYLCIYSCSQHHGNANTTLILTCL